MVPSLCSELLWPLLLPSPGRTRALTWRAVVMGPRGGPAPAVPAEWAQPTVPLSSVPPRCWMLAPRREPPGSEPHGTCSLTVAQWRGDRRMHTRRAALVEDVAALSSRGRAASEQEGVQV